MKMTTEDKRIAFMVINIVMLITLFFAALASLEDKSWAPLIITAQLVGAVIATLAFFYVAIRFLWAMAQRIFKDK